MDSGSEVSLFECKRSCSRLAHMPMECGSANSRFRWRSCGTDVKEWRWQEGVGEGGEEEREGVGGGQGREGGGEWKCIALMEELSGSVLLSWVAPH